MNIRKLALDALVQISKEQAFSNLEINQIIKENKLSKIDQNLLIRLIYGTLQHLNSINFILEKYIKQGFSKLKSRLKWILRLAVFQIIYLDKIPDYAIVNEAVVEAKEINKRYSGLVNGTLRNIIRNRSDIKTELKNSNNPEIKYSLPNWIIKKYKEVYGKDANEILNHINDIPDLYIRVNPKNFEYVYEELEKIGAQPKKDLDLDKNALIIQNPAAFENGIANSKLYQKGLFTVQDKGAIEIGLALEPQKGEQILDICAAPGGKSTHLAELIEDSGRIDAFDIHPHRVKLIELNAKRLKLKSINPREFNAEVFNPDLVESYDRILVDAPCSGLGIIRRKPEIRYNITQKDIKNLTTKQYLILKNAIKYLKKGGTLVYSTCTVNPDENLKIVEKIINENNGTIQLVKDKQTSLLDNSDGFYYAVLKKNNCE